MKKALSTTQAPAAIGPYSQGIDAGTLVFVSGQIPVDPATGEVVTGSVGDMTHRCLTNAAAVLAEAGLTLDNVIKTTVFLTDMNDFAAMNEVYATFFPGTAPARSAVAVCALPKGVKVEIECIASK